MRPLAIARLDFKRMFRQKANYFFVFVFPMALILVLGAAFGGAFKPALGVVRGDGGALERSLIADLGAQDTFDITTVDDEAAVIEGVERGRFAAGMVVPRGYDEAVTHGRSASVRFVARSDQMRLRSTVQAAVARQAAVLRGARFAQSERGVTFDEGLARAQAASRDVAPIAVTVTTVGEALFDESGSRFGAGASSQLILFVFLMSMMGGIALIESRRLGVIRRMLSTPTAARDVIVGDGLGRFAIAIMQGLVIMVGSWLIFRVNWGDPLGAAALLMSMALVGSGAGMMIGSFLRTEQQAVATSLLLGLSMGALGGSMVPPEIFSDTVRAVSHITPHAWAMDGFTELIRHGGTLGDVATQVGVLVVYGAALLLIASWRLRRVITR